MLLFRSNIFRIITFLSFPERLPDWERGLKYTQVFMGNIGNKHRSMSNDAKCNAPPTTHYKARCAAYPRHPEIKRYLVEDDQVQWNTPCKGYSPVDFTAKNLITEPLPPWSDIDIRYTRKNGAPLPKYNTLDDTIDRQSLHGEYTVTSNVYKEEIGAADIPQNPVGRTGMIGRGLLGRWGPNHAADPIVTRWLRKENVIEKDPVTGKPILQFIAIQRADSGEWALPGGMRSPGEEVSLTLKREFGEETMNSLEVSDTERARITQQVADLFHHGTEVYCGYVDDPRNTDNAWMETVAFNFHDETGESVGKFKLHAGDDAVGVRWANISQALKLYASHLDFIKKTVDIHNAHW